MQNETNQLPLNYIEYSLLGVWMQCTTQEVQFAGTQIDRVLRSQAGQQTWPVLQELLAIQNNGAKNLGFFGTRNMGFLHQKLVEILSYAMVITGNHVYTSGGTGTNAAVIRGALRANEPELLTVILPQSLERQPEELHELLLSVQQLVTMPENDEKTLLEASRWAPSCASLENSLPAELNDQSSLW
jgi:hypothetical protein